MPIDNLLVAIRATFDDDASQGIKGVGNEIEGLGKRGKFLSGVVSGLGGIATVGAGAIAGLGAAAIASTVGVSQSANELSRLSSATGVNVKGLSQLKFAFEQTRIDADELAPVLAAMNVVIGEANLGDEMGQSQLALLGVDIKNLQNLSPEEVFYQIADGVAAIEDPAVRTKAVAQVFGEDVSNKLIPLLSQGSAGLREFASEADALGVSLDEATVKDSKEFEDSLRDLQNQFKGLAMQVGKVLMPILTKLAKSVLPIVQKAIKFLAPLLEASGNIVAFLAEKFLGVVNVIYGALEPAFRFLTGVLTGLGLIQVPNVDTTKFKNSVGTEEGGLQKIASDAAAAVNKTFGGMKATVNTNVEGIAATDPTGNKVGENVQALLDKAKTIMEQGLSPLSIRVDRINGLLAGISDAATRNFIVSELKRLFPELGTILDRWIDEKAATLRTAIDRQRRTAIALGRGLSFVDLPLSPAAAEAQRLIDNPELAESQAINQQARAAARYQMWLGPGLDRITAEEQRLRDSGDTFLGIPTGNAAANLLAMASTAFPDATARFAELFFGEAPAPLPNRIIPRTLDVSNLPVGPGLMADVPNYSDIALAEHYAGRSPLGGSDLAMTAHLNGTVEGKIEVELKLDDLSEGVTRQVQTAIIEGTLDVDPHNRFQRATRAPVGS